MVQLVGDHCVLLAQQSLKQAAIGVEAGGVEDAVVGAQEGGDLALQFLVLALGATDKADRAHAVTPAVITLLSGGNQLRTVG